MGKNTVFSFSQTQKSNTMRIFALILTLLGASNGFVNAQCDLSNLQPINAQGQVLFADEECTDADGWTHFYNTTQNKLLLSIKKNGQDIGSIDIGMSVQAGTLPLFGTGTAFNLSGADYIDNEIWVVSNRYWQITGANPLANPVEVRFYMSNTDVSDIAGSVDDFGFLVDEAKDLYMYTISGANGLFPLSTSTQPFNASYTLYDMFPGGPPEWADGDFNGFPFGEFTVSTLDNGGGAGFLIFQSSPALTVSGNIARPNNLPVPDVNVQAATISIDTTDANGDFTCASLLSGSDYELVPTKDINHAEGISVIDLIAINAHLMGTQLLPTPYQLIAADADKGGTITFADLISVRNILLGTAQSFPNNQSWRFVPNNYVFPNPANPFAQPFPERIAVPNLQDTLIGQDFIGIKIGDVAEPSTAQPPALNTSFLLGDLNACNAGDTVVFDLTVEDFQNIRGFQFTLEWDENVLDYVGASNYTLPSFNNAIGSAAANDGKLTFAWFAQQSPNGISLADGTAICKLRFVANGAFGSNTALNFTNSITNMLVVHQNFAQATPNADAGSFVIDNNTTISASAFVQTTDCTNPNTGAIDLNANGGTPPLNYVWSNGALTQDIFGLTNGNYSVTITDASGGCPLVQTYEVTPPAAININAIVSDISCAFVADGAIELQLTGGEAPFSYQWSNGNTTRFNEDLYIGTYTVTVTDGAGCTTTASYVIDPAPQLMPVVMVTNASNPTANDGSVVISAINGGTGPFSYIWNNGAITQSLMDIAPGDYIVTITDGAGCQYVFGYEVYGLFTGTVEAGSSLSSVGAFPNPVTAGNAFDLVFTMETAAKVKAMIIAADGKIVGRELFQLPFGQSFSQMQAPAISGFYMVYFEIDGQPAGRLKMVVH